MANSNFASLHLNNGKAYLFDIILAFPLSGFEKTFFNWMSFQHPQ